MASSGDADSEQMGEWVHVVSKITSQRSRNWGLSVKELLGMEFSLGVEVDTLGECG